MRHHHDRRDDADTCDSIDPNTGDELSYEQLIEALVSRLLSDDTLEQLCVDADLPVLVDDTGEPVTVTARTYPDAGVLTLDRGIWLEMSDGSAFGLTVTVSRRPSIEVHLRH
ncbi:hypothetical protein Dvina_51550 [Dactylosporangium vinaceum]|uniref:Halobacterial output domain-containing protein n=1 Tax=Dactylosporangium vinaceum TaxID=53362 RepID=A0ABV5M2K6_9ACTN|nr:hypothetical protein [Dactylosporangium vinaceum]UAB96283.1 hypothetical protein Dvina_51550 [Dactylosporangium vinaceum]